MNIGNVLVKVINTGSQIMIKSEQKKKKEKSHMMKLLYYTSSK